MDIISAQQMGVDSRSDPSQLTYSGPEWLTFALSIEERQFVISLTIQSSLTLFIRIDVRDRSFIDSPVLDLANKVIQIGTRDNERM